MSQPCDSRDCRCPLKEVLNEKRHVTLEHVHYDRSGNPIHVEVHGIPIFDEFGNVTQMIEYCLDITQRRKQGKTIPIVALTAFAMKGDKEKYLADGFDDYISKPLDVDMLLSKINDLLA